MASSLPGPFARQGSSQTGLFARESSLADEGDQDVLRRIVELPLFWATMGRRIIQLDLAQSQMAGGLEVEFFRNPADITE